jgi:formyltetrahydrofolate synthetase
MPKKIEPIVEIAGELGLKEDELELYGRYIVEVWLAHASSGI